MQNRNTNQRNLILEIMKGNTTHPTADEIYEQARAIDNKISRGTVYRNLGLLSDQGKILKISTTDGPDHYDSTLSEHYHFCCKECNRMFDVPPSVKIEIQSQSKEMETEGFVIDGHNLIFTGLCPECNI